MTCFKNIAIGKLTSIINGGYATLIWPGANTCISNGIIETTRVFYSYDSISINITGEGSNLCIRHLYLQRGATIFNIFGAAGKSDERHHQR